MAIYWIGDIQGCDAPLGQFIDQVGFSASRDRLYVLGDLVNRGPASLQVLRRLQNLGNSVQCVLGNHDMHLLALNAGAKKPSKSDTLNEVLMADDKEALLHWLRHQALVRSLLRSQHLRTPAARPSPTMSTARMVGRAGPPSVRRRPPAL